MKDCMTRVKNALLVGASTEDIHAMLVNEGLSAYDIFLTYKAGVILAQDQVNYGVQLAEAELQEPSAIRPSFRSK